MNQVGRRDGPVRILVLCTANQCRSPVGAALLRRRFTADGSNAEVLSAGVFGDGSPVPEVGQSVLAARGIDLARHRSAPMTPVLVAGADLVVGMERSNVREAVALVPEIWPRAFTFPDLIRRGHLFGPRSRGEPLERYLEKVGTGRQRDALLGSSPDDDVTDPMGRDAKVWTQVVDDLEWLTSRLVALLALPSAARSLRQAGAGGGG